MWKLVFSAVLSSSLLLNGCAPSQTSSIPDLGGNCDKIASYNIDFKRFDEVAQQLVHATGCMIETDLSKYGHIQPHRIRGTMSIRQALRIAIQGTPLKIIHEEKNKITIGQQ
ncbi:hypothetical protein [Vibrio mangrovi]|uniref:Secretin/TonB short N-terminal domain-containing protein n=1 Tax=Vibrio mangrovi TaxID=474394 RepID=A0A1Y6IW49_9VIBR|nr:hypothetical protein [Vibrio mangrovi]MDW6005080.1 hypothetical protein [Vibrio mangrovi]SMS01848.1 hypothetical protein VIM7927_03156 [Vibrio mangrovi]